ncbi:hypothetical protein [Hyphococcus sp.]|uniref:hypothetical protein n=1 Tax=Hyphococcus sp. TaxID=2038636 RepID=UPI003CCB90E9
MAYWIFAGLFAVVALILYGKTDPVFLIYAIAMAAPLFIVISLLQFMRSIFSRHAALSLGQLFASLTALAVIFAYLTIGYY